MISTQGIVGMAAWSGVLLTAAAQPMPVAFDVAAGQDGWRGARVVRFGANYIGLGPAALVPARYIYDASSHRLLHTGIGRVGHEQGFGLPQRGGQHMKRPVPPVPEPAGWVMLVAGCIALMAFQHRRPPLFS